MKKKEVLIEEEDFIKMESIKKKTGATINWQIREAIKQYLNTENK